MPIRPTIAGVVLTLNEETTLPRALTSLCWCDELVVVDSGSSDKTELVANNHNARFYTNIQKPPFEISSQRNWALHNCDLTSDWVFFLDADEEVGSELHHQIRHTLLLNTIYDSYELTPRYWFLGRWLKRTQGFPNWHPRLLRRSSVSFIGGVWESFSPNSTTGRLYTPYEHYAFSKGIDDWVMRHLRYADWDARKIYQYHKNKSTISSRKHLLRRIDASLWPLKPVTRFAYKFFLCGGVLEGWQALIYCSLIAFYDLITVVKLIEIRRTSKGLPL